MTKDVVPELLDQILAEYEKQIEGNQFISSFLKKLEKETAKDSDVSLYGNELGECAAKAFLKYIIPENLPDGKLYWNIAERVINSLLTDVYNRVNSAADSVQKVNDERDNIHIKPQHELYPKEQIRRLADKAIEVYEKGTDEWI